MKNLIIYIISFVLIVLAILGGIHYNSIELMIGLLVFEAFIMIAIISVIKIIALNDEADFIYEECMLEDSPYTLDNNNK